MRALSSTRCNDPRLYTLRIKIGTKTTSTRNLSHCWTRLWYMWNTFTCNDQKLLDNKLFYQKKWNILVPNSMQTHHFRLNFYYFSCIYHSELQLNKANTSSAKNRNRYNQVPHLSQDTNGKVTNSQIDTTNESQEVSPSPAGDHKAHINRLAQRHSKHKTEKT